MRSNRSARPETGTGYDVIPPDRVSGETFSRPSFGRRREIADAEFEVIAEARPASPPGFNDNNRVRLVPIARPVVALPQQTGRIVAGIEGGLRTIPAKGFAGLAVFFCMIAFLAVYFYWPANRPTVMASAGGLVITEVSQSPVDANGFRVVELSGVVQNRSGKPQSIPAVIAELSADNGAVSKAAVSLGDQALGAGKSAHFFMRIPYPGGKQPKVRVSFAPRGV